MIQTPNFLEIELAYQEVQRTNTPIDRYSNVILVPHAGIHESRVVALTAMRYLPEHSQVVIIGTNHFKLHQEHTGLTHIDKNSDTWNTEHSIRITSALLEFLGHTTQEYVFADTSEASIELLLNKLYTGWNLVFTSDLSHYVPEYVAVRMEDPYLEKIAHGAVFQFKDQYNQHGPCGVDNIQLYSRILYIRNEAGRIVEYRHSPGTNVVGYSGIVASGKDWLKLLSFDFRYLLKHARIALTDVLNEREIYTPTWPVWKYYKQGAFVTLRSQNKTRACIGRLEKNSWSEENNTLKYISDSTRDCVRDAKDRWHKSLQIEELDKLRITVEILEPRRNWQKYSYNQILNLKLTPGDNYGFYIQYNTGESGIFLPDVWREFPSLTQEELLKMLEEKALGLKLDRLRENSTNIYIYQTLSISE